MGSNNTCYDEIMSNIFAAESASDYSAKGFLNQALSLLRDNESKLTEQQVSAAENQIYAIADKRNISL